MSVFNILVQHLHEPLVGEEVYFPTRLFLSRGNDDTAGGIGEVLKVETKWDGVFVHVRELPGVGINWKILRRDQAKLCREFGSQRCYPDPDNRPSMNTGGL